PEALRLRMSEVTVETADTATAALDGIASRDYDAIVTDIKMPGMDGLALLAEIRGRRPDTPILIITGHGEYDLALRALRGGAYDSIQKPLHREDVVRAAAQRQTQQHTSALQSRFELVCRPLIAKKKRICRAVQDGASCRLHYCR